jgi:hypothetical protein
MKTPCKCKSCNPKFKTIRVSIPKGHKWIDTTKKGSWLVIKLLEIKKKTS